MIEVVLAKSDKGENRGKIRFAWSNLSSGNCGVYGLSHFYAQYLPPTITKQSVDGWGQKRPIEVPDPAVKGKAPDGLEVYKLLVANIDQINKQVGNSGIVFLSDRMVETYTYGLGPKVRITDKTIKEQASLNAKSAPSTTYLNTGCLIRAIRESKVGAILSSPLVENQNHKGASGIVAALWIPNLKYIIDPSYGVRGIPKKGNEKLDSKLKELGAEFVETFYE